MHKGRVWSVVVVGALVVAAGCGGGAGDPPTPTTDPSVSATPTARPTASDPSTSPTADGSTASTSEATGTSSETETETVAESESEVRTESESEVRTEAGGWLGGTPPASVVAHFDASGMAFQYAQCVVTLAGPSAPTGPDFPVLVLYPELVEAMTVGRLASRDADLDVSGFQVGGVVWDAIPSRLPPPPTATRTRDVPSDDLDLVPLDEVPTDEQVLDTTVLRDLVTLPSDVLLPFVEGTGDGAADGDLELVEVDGGVRRVDALDAGDWDDLRIELDPTTDEDQVLPVPPADLDFEAIVLADNVACGVGWARDALVHLTIVDAEGTTQVDTQVQVDAVGELSVVWVPDPGTAPGVAVVTVDGGAHRASDTVTVVPATSPRVAVLGEPSVPAGAPARVGLSGFEAGEEVALQAYRGAEGSPGWDWVGAPPAATVDDDGQSVYELVTAPADPAGRYCLVLPGHVPVLASHCSNAGFDLEAP